MIIFESLFSKEYYLITLASLSQAEKIIKDKSSKKT